MSQSNPVQRKVTTEPRTSRVTGGTSGGATMLVGALIIALAGVLLVAFGALPAAVLVIVAVPLAFVATKLIKRGRPHGTA